MKPAAAALLPVLLAAGCYTRTSTLAAPAAVVNDPCAARASAAACAAGGDCLWSPLTSQCPSGTACPDGVCVTPDPCGALADRAACEADARCAWSGLRLATSPVDLCLVGQSCDAGGYCRARGGSGGGCTCVQPLACPANADCPAVQCDCSNPPPGGAVGGGGTCTCTCPACPAGESCPPCSCDCAGGGCGSGATGDRTCACVCPTCAPGTTCAPCSCACGAGEVQRRRRQHGIDPHADHDGGRRTCRGADRSLRGARRRSDLHRRRRQRLPVDRAGCRVRDRAVSERCMRSGDNGSRRRRRGRRRVRLRLRRVRDRSKLPALRVRLLRFQSRVGSGAGSDLTDGEWDKLAA